MLHFIYMKFNEVTWYSKLAAIIFFIGVLPALTFYIGVQVGEINESLASNQTVVIPDSNHSVSQPTPTRFSRERGGVVLEKDILIAHYEISADFGISKTKPQMVSFSAGESNTGIPSKPIYIDSKGKITTTYVTGAEAFWIYKYEYSDSSKTEAKVYIGGNWGASAQDDRLFSITIEPISGYILTKEIKRN